ncbi:MAG: glycosyltransferase family 4 protein [Kiritimatiellae bacterium]|nr:glycosyltransferase family 4 protein [Kiritimatiellia bacterium]
MRLLVSCIPYDGGKSGISVYTRGLVGELRRRGHRLTLLAEPGVPAEAILGTAGGSAAAAGNVRVVSAPGWTKGPVASMLWHLFALPWWILRRRKEFDGFVICAANRRVCAFYPLPTAATVHDLANFRIPGKYSPLRMFYLRYVLPRFAKKAGHLVAVSAATAADMVRFWGCREGDVAVLHEGFPAVPEGWGGAAGKNLLYISRIEHPGKNHVRLIEAYGRLPRALAEAHPLVLAGADWKDAEVVKAAAAASPHASSIRFAGFVPEGAAMEKLWSETGFYVFPSLFEGFGLSLAEAMARGIPCACSGNGALAEVGGDAAVSFDPEDSGDIARALETLLGEGDGARRARVERGLARAKAFSWAAHAEGLERLLTGDGT